MRSYDSPTRRGGCSYSLHEPKQHTTELYVKIMKKVIPKKLTKELISAFEASSNGSSHKSRQVRWRMLFRTLLCEKF